MSRASHALGLLDALFDHPAYALARVLTIRQVPHQPSSDIGELINQFTSPEAVWRQVSQLTTDEIDVLMGLPETGDDPLAQTLINSLLAVERGGQRFAIAEVVTMVREHLPEKQPSLPNTPPAAGAEAVSVDVAGVCDHIEQIARVVDYLDRDSGQPVSSGTLAKDLDSGSEEVESLIDSALRLGLIRRVAGGLRSTDSGSEWLSRGIADKWAWCLEQFRLHAPAWWPQPLPAESSSLSLQGLARHRYPLVSSSDAESLVSLARRVGVIRGTQPTLLDQAPTPTARASMIDSLVPPPANQLYPDGPDTLVATGPLDSTTTRALRAMSSWLSGELAPRFRIDPGSITRALQSGVSAESIRDVLTKTVSVGMAPALMEMFEDTVARATALTLQATPTGSLLTSNTALTLELIMADRRLQTASFRRSDSDGVHSPLGVAQIHDLLLGEGYPHLVKDSSGALIMMTTRQEETAASRNRWSEDAVERWREHMRQARQAVGFFDGVIELAISERVPITVTVSMGESTQEMTIEPHALRNGRLRGRDIRSDVERTLPVSHVVAVRADPTLS